MILIDTDILSLLHREDSTAPRIRKRIRSDGVPVATTIITFQEQMQGYLAVINQHNRDVHKQVPVYASLQKLIDEYKKYRIVAFTKEAADLFEKLRKEKVRVASMDLRIACVALSLDALLLTRNITDFENVPNLKCEDPT